MGYAINYANSETKAFDAVQDVMTYLDGDYPAYASGIKTVTNCRQFAFYCALIGIKGYPVKAWYDHFHGEGAWIEPD